ncbi:hypothetical protein [Streptomyces sp. NPDC058084]|uniref:hypothetical protein n=1 Tax=Streptomyces sp. NPDC058084 TaxID=3346333 RepID=UPI0036EE83A9
MQTRPARAARPEGTVIGHQSRPAITYPRPTIPTTLFLEPIYEQLPDAADVGDEELGAEAVAEETASGAG